MAAVANTAGPPLSPLPRAPRQLERGWRLLVPVAIVLYLCVALTHAYRAPAGGTGYQNAPDEEAHVSFVRAVAAGRLPSGDGSGGAADSQPGYEWHQPPLYYFLAARFLPLGERGMRLFSVLIGVGCILTIYRCGRLLLPERPETAALAAGITALIPGHCAITSVVNNDGLLELCFSLYMLGWIIVLTRRLSAARSLFLGLILGVSLLTKATALLLLPLTLVALPLLWRNGETRSATCRCGILIVGIAGLVSGWWFVRNGIMYHEWLPVSAFRQSFAGTAQASDVVAGRTGLPVDSWPGYASLVARWTFQSFFAVYSTASGARWGVPSFLPEQLYVLAALITGGALVGLAILRVRRRDELTRTQTYGLYIVSTALILVGASFALFTARYFQAQGRYFYPAMLPLSLLGARGWRALFPHRYVGIASVLLLAFLFAFCLAFLRYEV